MKYFVIINPNSGGRRGEKIWGKIHQILQSKNIDFDFALTNSRGHAVEISCNAIYNGFRHFIVLGGDGTLNEVVNGVFSQSECSPNSISLGVIPVGTGNDWRRMYGISKDPVKALKVILKNNTILQDVGLVSYNHKGIEKDRFFINGAGLGYDALVTRRSNLCKERGFQGKWVYWLQIIGSVFKHKSNRIRLTVNGELVLQARVYTISVGICKYSGGGIPQVPNAISDDGLFDIMVLKRINILKAIGCLPQLFNGTFVKLNEVKTFRAKEISIKSDDRQSIYLETDGESLGHSPCLFKVIKRSIKMNVPIKQ
ncbi:MAG: diacylglycerol kinase family protein [Bacteroidales bacterium]